MKLRLEDYLKQLNEAKSEQQYIQEFNRQLDELLLDPKIRQKVYPRVYEGVSAWNNLKDIARHVLAELLAPQFYGKTNVLGELVAHWSSQMEHYGHPTYFLQEQFLEAVMRTSYPEDLMLKDFKLPFPAGQLIFPKGMIQHRNGDVFGWLAWMTHPKGFAIMSCNDKSCWLWGVLSPEMLKAANDLPDFPLEVQELVDPEKDPPPDLPLDQADREILHTLTRVFVNVVLLMESRPQYLEPGERLRTVRKKDRMTEFWKPNVVGARYRILSKPAERKAGSGDIGSHVRPHWVRGHLRNQACGPKWSERKLIWIEPYYVERKDNPA